MLLEEAVVAGVLRTGLTVVVAVSDTDEPVDNLDLDIVDVGVVDRD